MDRPKRIKREPLQDPSDEEGARAPKQAASPAQEATRAHIINLETQMSKLKSEGKLDPKGSFQIRCLEEELRKAHSKLRRLLNEAERQRRRRERLRGGAKNVQPTDDGVMAALKSCTRFQDFVRELNVLGFTLTPSDEQVDTGDSLPEVEGVKVQVELIEGDEEFAPEIKTEYNSSTPDISIVETSSVDVQGEDQWRGESYRQWFERQTQLQQRWEENFMREQMELTRSLLESVTSTFLQGVQQVLNNIHAGRRFPPFCPDPPT